MPSRPSSAAAGWLTNFHEELTVLNHSDEPIDVKVGIEAASDFADLFEVKDALAKKGCTRPKSQTVHFASCTGVTHFFERPSSPHPNRARWTTMGSGSRSMSNRTMSGKPT